MQPFHPITPHHVLPTTRKLTPFYLGSHYGVFPRTSPIVAPGCKGRKIKTLGALYAPN